MVKDSLLPSSNEFKNSFSKFDSSKMIDFGSILSGATKVVGLVKNAAPVVKGLFDTVGDFFGSRRKTIIQKVDLSEIKSYLAEIRTKIEGIARQNDKILEQLEAMERRILDAIENSQTLTRRHGEISDAISGNDISNIDSWSGALWELSKIEERPTEIIKMIAYYEAYIMCYPLNAETKNTNESKFFNPIFKVFQNSNILQRNAQKQNALISQRIEQLSFMVVFLHKIAFYKFPETVKDSTVNYNQPNYEMQIESLKDLTIKHNQKLLDSDKAFLDIYETQIKSIIELETLQKVYNYYLEAEQAIKLYNLSLIESYETDGILFDSIFSNNLSNQ